MKPFVLSIRNSIDNLEGPGEIDSVSERIVLRELDQCIEGVNRPRVVLDCSELKGMGRREVGLLMSCLERVMKRNGDARLAGLSPRAMEILSRTGVERLFRIYDSREMAVRSFESHPDFEIAGDDGFGGARSAFEESGRTKSRSPFRYVVRAVGERSENCEEESS
ncbi:MAG TPA: STAS domain-containing protein [Terracidiphilus sp.]|nr:STAS domain-containing protein [Terracidiphilus sp.]